MADRVGVTDRHQEPLVGGDDDVELAQAGLGDGAHVAAVREFEVSVSRRGIEQLTWVGRDRAAEVADPAASCCAAARACSETSASSSVSRKIAGPSNRLATASAHSETTTLAQ
jgi:hypothetical protein